ncbi:MAG: hypothetical protein AB7I18_03290 [Candidatus Berkiella sp.]
MSMQGNETIERVTIGLYSSEFGADKLPEKFHGGMFNEKENIRKIIAGLTEAARKSGKKPPEFVLSVLLIPNWNKEGNGYNNQDYQSTKQAFVEKARQEFGDLIRVEDLYEEGNLTEEEKAYMDHLQQGGSNADIIKTRAIINNQGNRHLQLDSNTLVKDYDTLYGKTFGLDQDQQQDGLNACFYRQNYLDAHNKMVYTAPEGRVAPALANRYLEYVRENQHNANEKKPGKNSVFDNVFPPALCDAGLTHHNTNVFGGYSFYPPNLDAPEFHLTSEIVTAINMSWSTKKPDLMTERLKKEVAPLLTERGTFDFPSIAYIAKKYTGLLPNNSVDSDSPSDSFEKFMNISDWKTDLNALASYFKHVATNNPDLISALVKIIPNTSKGNVITQQLFDCSVTELHQDPNRVFQYHSIDQLQSLDQALINTDREQLLAYTKRSEEYMPLRALNKVTGSAFKDLSEIKGDRNQLIFEFFLCIERAHLELFIDHMSDVFAKLDPTLRAAVLEEAKRLLESANDNPWHYNYIANRAESSKLLEHPALIEDQQASRRQKVHFAFDRVKKEEHAVGLTQHKENLAENKESIETGISTAKNKDNHEDTGLTTSKREKPQ